MNADGVLATVVVATGANVYGASIKGKDPIIPMIGGFVVGAFLLALSEGAPELAELFAAAYAITSLSVNATPLIDTVVEITGGTLTASQKSQLQSAKEPAQSASVIAGENNFNSINPQVTSQ